MFEAIVKMNCELEDLNNFILKFSKIPKVRVEIKDAIIHVKLINNLEDDNLLAALLKCGITDYLLLDSAGQVDAGEPSKVSDSLPESEERSKVIDNLPESEELSKASGDSLSESEDPSKPDENPDKNPEEDLSKILHGETIEEIVENLFNYLELEKTDLKKRFTRAIKSLVNYTGRIPGWQEFEEKGITRGDKKNFTIQCNKKGLKAYYVKKIIFTYCKKYCAPPKMEHLFEIKKEDADMPIIEELEAELKRLNTDNTPIGPQVLAIFQKYFRIGFMPEEAEKYMIDELSDSIIDPSSYSEESRLFWANVASNLREIYGFSKDEREITSFEFLETIKRFVSN